MNASIAVRGVFDDRFRSHHKEFLKTIQQTLRLDQLAVKGVFLRPHTGWIDLGKGEAMPVNTRSSASKTDKLLSGSRWRGLPGEFFYTYIPAL